MEYVRISREFWDYALFPEDIDIDKLILKFGENKAYYESIYRYNEEHYNKFIQNLKNAAANVGVPFNTQNLINVVSQVRRKLRTKIKKGDASAQELLDSFSIAGTQDVKTRKLVFDFDDVENPELAREDTLELCSRLISKGFPRDTIQLAYSGNKGFSVEIETDTYFNRQEFENIISNLSNGLQTFDESVKDEQRLFRIPLTKHNVSGLYKIPLTLEQLNDFGVDSIKKMAKAENVKLIMDEYYDVMDTWNVAVTPEAIQALKNLNTEQKKEVDENISFEDRLELSRKPPWLTSTKFALQEGFFKEGERNNAFMILAATYKAHGFPPQLAWRMLKGVAELQAKRTGGKEYDEQKLWREIISTVYNDMWRGGTYSEKETALLKKTAERFNLNMENAIERDLTNISTSIERFKEYARNFSKNRIKTGMKTIDSQVTMMTGMAIGLLGGPGAGKTSFANKFMKYTSTQGERCLFECLDMTENFQIARLLQEHVSYSFEQILQMLEDDNVSPELSKAFDKVAEEYENLSINYRSGTTIDDIENDVKKHKDLYGEYPRLVVVDYLEKIRGPYSDPTANSGYVASRLADIARDYNVCMLVLLQPQKSAGDAREPLLSMRKVKGASVIEQDLRVILTMWRPGFNPEDNSNDQYTSIAVVKNNMGQIGKMDFIWDGLSGTIRDMTAAEQVFYEDFMEELKAKKAEEEKQKWQL